MINWQRMIFDIAVLTLVGMAMRYFGVPSLIVLATQMAYIFIGIYNRRS